MPKNKDGYLEIKTREELEEYTGEYREYLKKYNDLGVNVVNKRYKIDKLQIGTTKHYNENPNMTQEEIKESLGFKKDEDLIQTSKEVGIYRFLSEYCGNLFDKINKYLRNGMKETTDGQSQAPRIDILEDNGGNQADIVSLSPEESLDMIMDEFCRFETKEDMILWRVIDRNSNFDPFIKRPPFGGYIEKGFLSCGSILDILMKTDVAERSNTIRKIKVPKGAPAMFMNYISKRDNELEWLLPPGTEIRQTSRAKGMPFGRKTIECEAVFDEKILKRQKEVQRMMEENRI